MKSSQKFYERSVIQKTDSHTKSHLTGSAEPSDTRVIHGSREEHDEEEPMIQIGKLHLVSNEQT